MEGRGNNRLPHGAGVSESAKRFKNFIDAAPVGVYQTTRAGGILYINNTLARMLGFATPEEAISKKSLDRYRNPIDRAALIQMLDSAGSVTNHEVEFTSATGQVLNVLMSATVRDGIISGTMIDITERRKAEGALKKERETFYFILENDPSGVVLIDTHGV